MIYALPFVGPFLLIAGIGAWVFLVMFVVTKISNAIDRRMP